MNISFRFSHIDSRLTVLKFNFHRTIVSSKSWLCFSYYTLIKRNYTKFTANNLNVTIKGNLLHWSFDKTFIPVSKIRMKPSQIKWKRRTEKYIRKFFHFSCHITFFLPILFQYFRFFFQKIMNNATFQIRSKT